MRPGVEKTSDGRCVASVLRMISLAKELFSSSPKQMQAVEPLQVVEAVAVLQLLELVFEHEVEGRAQHAAERHLRFSARPPIQRSTSSRPPSDAAGIGAGAVEEVEAVGLDAAKPADR